ncbi:hypothetical protein BWI75_18530 [Gloeocapsopsis sp. AAB1 = 1H9]|uniref:Uncharacterized protein n=1 Tax=Gloeocapsopsis dulcis AAB1 = 1H9 TaxID=1433147 RepID=A0A6N8G046_9CHRO|nr:hypothetical protein [Gloeocapsopsis dulcis AAB1 = 1H9]
MILKSYAFFRGATQGLFFLEVIMSLKVVIESNTGTKICWNSVMDEQTYLVQKWNEFVAA